MSLLERNDLAFARSIARLVEANPFLPERIEAEKAALGGEFVSTGPVLSVRPEASVQNPNLPRLAERTERLVSRLRERLAAGASASTAETALYEDLVLYLLYSRYEDRFWALIVAAGGKQAARVGLWPDFARDASNLLDLPGVELPGRRDHAHLFALLFQVRRAFHHVFRHIVGGSMPAARLRAAIWQSIFTHDIRRYRRALYDRMGDITTLVTGPSGTGKELVARAIALSRYVAFDARGATFAADFAAQFFPLHLAALSPTLIESELFGHRRGSFTGALADREGWLEVCPPSGAVFLDEIGELDVALQVKLLRVLQERSFQRIGESAPRAFRGKVIAATNRDLATEMRAGRFREDLYYRLCADLVETPSLAEQLDDSPDDLPALLAFIAARVAPEAEAETLAAEVEGWIDGHLGRGYRWPGNFRELEQCVRNVLVRREYAPPAAAAGDGAEDLVARMREGALTAAELVGRYCTLVYARTGSYLETARRLGLDRRTVRAKIDRGLLGELDGTGERD